jgi:hypothetical protein
MEPHTSTARWDGDRLTVHTSSQGTTLVRATLAVPAVEAHWIEGDDPHGEQGDR